ncbi:hypothetical protein Lal_00019878 [Lupinus albus]|nr:hypothetical protein Lal_00019878 [Lupinus albus]
MLLKNQFNRTGSFLLVHHIQIQFGSVNFAKPNHDEIEEKPQVVVVVVVSPEIEGSTGELPSAAGVYTCTEDSAV